VVSPPPLPTYQTTRRSKGVPAPLPADPSVLVPPAPSTPPSVPGVDFLDMAVRQLLCPAVQQLLKSAVLKLVQVPVRDMLLWCDTSGGRLRPLVPVDLRPVVFSAIHGVAHAGSRASRRLISSRFVWRGMASDINKWVKECLQCQRAKILRHAHPTPLPIPVPSRRFAHIHVDIVGPLPSSGGYTHLFTIVDRTTRWPEAIPLASTTASACAQALLHGWVARFGVPAEITSDRGAQFTSSVWSALSTCLNLRHSLTTAFHPQSNGLVERMHRRLKDALRARLAGPRWLEHLPWVLLGLRSAPGEASAVSPASSVYGAELCLPGEFLDVPDPPSPSFLDDLRRRLDQSAPVPVRHNLTSSPPSSSGALADLLSSEFVFVRRDGHVPALTPLYEGPYRVLSKSDRVFRILIGSKADSVAVSRLKPAYLPAGAGPALPPARGRPPRALAPGRVAAVPGLRRVRRVTFWLPS